MTGDLLSKLTFARSMLCMLYFMSVSLYCRDLSSGVRTISWYFSFLGLQDLSLRDYEGGSVDSTSRFDLEGVTWW
jgi:hypothetical protein